MTDEAATFPRAREELDTVPGALDAFADLYTAVEADLAAGGSGTFRWRARVTVSSTVTPRRTGTRGPTSWLEMSKGARPDIRRELIDLFSAIELISNAGVEQGWRLTGRARRFRAWLTNPALSGDPGAAAPDDPQFVRWAAWLAELPAVDALLEQLYAMLEAEGQWAFDFFVPVGLVQGRNGEIDGVDDGTLFDDLADVGLLRRAGERNHAQRYSMPADARRFVAWRRRQPTPVERVAATAQRWLTGDDFASRHPTAAGALTAAFDLRHGGDLTDDAVVGQIGNLLRGALHDVAAVAARNGGPSEHLDGLLKELRAAATATRAAAALDALAAFASVAQKLNQAIDHVRDEQKHGRPRATDDEIDDACTYTAIACYALDRYAQRLP